MAEIGPVEMRTGRKRKQGHRYPSGDIVQDQESPHKIALRQPHRRDAPIGYEHDQRAETPLGRLNLIGAVSHEEYRAANRFARIVSRYRVVIDAPKSSVASNAGIMEPKKSLPVIDDADERKREYDGAFEALGTAGHIAACTVAKVAVQGEPCPHAGFWSLIRGLRALREHFEQVDRRGKSEYLGNRCL